MDQTDSCIARYSKTMPQYRKSLDLLRGILDFQTTLKEKIIWSNKEMMPCLRIELAAARKKWKNGLPLFENEAIPISASLFREALADLRSLLPEESTRTALDRLLASSLLANANTERLLKGLRTDGNSCIRRLAEATSTEPDIVAFLLHTVLSPFFEKQAALYREWANAAAWQSGICPMCGSEPSMARLAYDDGQRLLACFLCHTEWAFNRLRCPFCESTGQPLLRHFIVDNDREHRVDCCDKCHRYLKTVDERVSGRPAMLAVEEVITAHLDILARERGYR